MVKQFHDDMQARVEDNDETSEPFPVTNSVKMGCVLAPSLFSLMFYAMLTDAFRNLFNLRRLQVDTKVMTDIIRYFLFADACAINAGSEADLKKIEIMHQPAPGIPRVEPSVTANGQRLNVVNRFTYLGSTLSQNVVIDGLGPKVWN